jgi:hypothetical protein
VAQEYIIDENGNRVLTSDDELRELFRSDVLRVAGIDPSFVRKPDGTDVDNITGTPANPDQGSARRTFQADQTGATIDPSKVGKEEQDPTKTANPVTLEKLVDKASFEGPYDNILENFSTYNALWTLACLEPNQFNNPSTYRDNPAALTSVVFS